MLLRDEPINDILRMPAEGSSWVVLHARPRCEKKIFNYCEQQGLAPFLPLRKKIHRYGARQKTFWSPLFPGYLFCPVNSQQELQLKQNRYVANVLDVVDQQKLLNQLIQIRLALAVGDVVEVLPFLEVGKRVRVTQGAMKGLEGLVLRIKGKTRVVVNVDMIRQAVAVEVDSAYLDPA